LTRRSLVTAFSTPRKSKPIEPQLRTENLQGGALYYDAQANSPERLCVENIVEARERGACLFNYSEVTAALHSSDRVIGVRVKNTLDDDADEIEVAVRWSSILPVLGLIASQGD
jgi:glycerol-3-phosphate dehydrogenase